MTEKEAFNKSCPLDMSSTCVGSRCMAWRWDSIDNPDYHPMMASFGQGGKPVPTYIKSETDGHCGLAHC